MRKIYAVLILLALITSVQCQLEKIGEIVVHSDQTNQVYTPYLVAGECYTIEAYRSFSYWDGLIEGADAYYNYRDKSNLRPLLIDGRSMYDIAAERGDSTTFNEVDHFYATKISGTGKALGLLINDPGPYSDNHGSILVKVYKDNGC
jgi:hypothetical protein